MGGEQWEGEKVLVFLGEGGAASDGQFLVDLAPPCPESARVRNAGSNKALAVCAAASGEGKTGRCDQDLAGAPRPRGQGASHPGPLLTTRSMPTSCVMFMALEASESSSSLLSMAKLQLKPLKGRGSGGRKSSKTEPPEHASAGNRWFSDLSEGKVGALPNGRRRWVSRAHLVVEIGTGAWEEFDGRIWRLAENLSRLGCGSETPRRLGNLTWVRVHNSKGTMPSMPSPLHPAREKRETSSIRVKHAG